MRLFKLTVELSARPDIVFAALTEGRSIKAWSGQKGKVQLTIGGVFEMFDGWVKGRVLLFKPGKILSYSWHTSDWPEKAPDSIVKYTLTKSTKGTKVLLEHKRFPNIKEMESHKIGWMEHVFEPLEAYLQRRYRKL